MSCLEIVVKLIYVLIVIQLYRKFHWIIKSSYYETDLNRKIVHSESVTITTRKQYPCLAIFNRKHAVLNHNLQIKHAEVSLNLKMIFQLLISKENHLHVTDQLVTQKITKKTTWMHHLLNLFFNFLKNYNNLILEDSVKLWIFF